MQVIQSLANQKFTRGNEQIPIDLGIMPKSSSSAALEVADFIIHTAGRQVRDRNSAKQPYNKDFEAVFKSIDERLTGFKEITQIRSK